MYCSIEPAKIKASAMLSAVINQVLSRQSWSCQDVREGKFTRF